jgi:hypothetical protein
VPQQDRPVGWYRDSEEPSGHRYWDGEQWQTAVHMTSHTTMGPDRT